MAERTDVVWASDPFTTGSSNPRPWLVVAAEALPYPVQESIAVALTTSLHHPGSFAVPSDAWIEGEPQQQSYVLPWTVVTIKDEVHVVGVQGSVTAAFTDRVATVTTSYLDRSESVGPPDISPD